MRKREKLIGLIFGFITFCIVFAWMMPMQTQAISQKRKAMNAYKKYLSKTWLKHYNADGEEYKDDYYDDGSGNQIKVYAYAPKVKFAVAYINKDKIPELIVYTNGALNTDKVLGDRPEGQLYTYKSGKVICLGGFSLWKPSKSRYYKKRNLIADYAYSDTIDHEIQYFEMGREILIFKLTKSYVTKNSIEYLDWANAAIPLSKEQFNKKLKKMVGNKKPSKFKWHKNTKKNRKKYLK